MKTEKNYEFRKRMLEYHEKDILNFKLNPRENEMVLSDGCIIYISEKAEDVSKSEKVLKKCPVWKKAVKNNSDYTFLYWLIPSVAVLLTGMAVFVIVLVRKNKGRKG